MDKGFRAFRQALRVASQTPEADQPAKGTLNVPSLRLQLKTSTFVYRSRYELAIDENGFPFPLVGRLVFRLDEDLGFPAQVRLDPIEQGTAQSLIGKQVADARETPDEISKKQECSLSITDIGR